MINQYSQIVKYHESDKGIALLYSGKDNLYWIGEYSPFCTHQTPEPPYVWVSGDWTSREEAELSLTLWI